MTDLSPGLAPVAYILCALTALICTVLLSRAYMRTGVRFLVWAALCFGALTIENVVLFLDREVIHNMDLSPLRNGVALLGLLALLYGLIWDTNRHD